MTTPVRVGMATLGVNLCLNLLLYRPLQHVGPPLATSLASLVNAAVLAVLLLRRGYLRPDRRALSRLLRMGLAAAAMAAALFVLAHGPFVGLERRHGIARIAELGVLVLFGMAVYALGLQLLGVLELRTLRAGLSRRLMRRRHA